MRKLQLEFYMTLLKYNCSSPVAFYWGRLARKRVKLRRGRGQPEVKKRSARRAADANGNEEEERSRRMREEDDARAGQGGQLTKVLEGLTHGTAV